MVTSIGTNILETKQTTKTTLVENTQETSDEKSNSSEYTVTTQRVDKYIPGEKTLSAGTYEQTSNGEINYTPYEQEDSSAVKKTSAKPPKPKVQKTQSEEETTDTTQEEIETIEQNIENLEIALLTASKEEIAQIETEILSLELELTSLEANSSTNY